jgi:hypothetical protein
MKQIFTVVLGLLIVVGLGAGCGKSEKPADPSPVAGTEKWEPENIPIPEKHDVDDGEDHSGHDHD